MEIKYINLENLRLYDNELKEYLKRNISECIVKEDSYLNFPTIGDDSKFYIDISTNKLYRWDDVDLKYFVIGSDYEDIKTIDGCSD